MTKETTTEPLLQQQALSSEMLAQHYNAIVSRIYLTVEPYDAEKQLTTEQRQNLRQALKDLRQLLKDLENNSGIDISYVQAHIYFRAASIYAVLGRTKLAYQTYTNIVEMEIPSADRYIRTLKAVSEQRLRDFNVQDAENPTLLAEKLKLHNQQQMQHTYQAIDNTELALTLLGLLILLVVGLGSFSFIAYILITNPLTTIGTLPIITATSFFALLETSCLVGANYTFHYLNSTRKEASPFCLIPDSNLQAASVSSINPALKQVSEPSGNKTEQQATDKDSLIVASGTPLNLAPSPVSTASPQTSMPSSSPS